MIFANNLLADNLLTKSVLKFVRKLSARKLLTKYIFSKNSWTLFGSAYIATYKILSKFFSWLIWCMVQVCSIICMQVIRKQRRIQGEAQWHVVVPPFFARKKYEIGTEINTHLRDIIFAKFSCQIPWTWYSYLICFIIFWSFIFYIGIPPL